MFKLKDAFEQFQLPIPTRKMENWKYTPVQNLLSLEFDNELPRCARNDAERMTLEKNSDLLSAHPFAHLAINLANAIKTIEINESLATPLLIDFKHKGSMVKNIHQHIHVAENVQAEIVFEYSSEDETACFLNIFTEIFLEKNAKLSIYKKQTLNDRSFLIDFFLVNQLENSEFYSFTFDKGAALSRTDFIVNLNQPHSKVSLYGIYLTENEQVADHHSVIHHHVPHCQSAEHYRGILNDRSKAVFNGKIIIDKNAQKTKTQQLNKNLLLSNQAEVDTKPELEIYADDVKASHGATVGQLDEQALFYLQARGIGLDEARALLMNGFLHEVFLSIKNKSIREDFLNT